MKTHDPFGDRYEPKPKVNPFGDKKESNEVDDAATRMEHAARKIRQLKTQMGAEGLSLPATRDLIDEVSIAIDAAARALRRLDR